MPGLDDLELDLLTIYRRMHDRLESMFENCQQPTHIPEEYEWLLETLANARAASHRLDCAKLDAGEAI